MIEGKTLRTVPVPDFSKFPTAVAATIKLADELLANPGRARLDLVIEEVTTELYGLTNNDLWAIGLR